MIDAWRGKSLLIIVDSTCPEAFSPPQARYSPVFENEGYRVYRLELPQTDAYLPLFTSW